MHHRILTIGFVAAATLFMAVSCGDYLTEKPAFITPCVVADPSFNRCYANNFQSFLREWKDGVPGLKSLGPLDPFLVKRISIVQDKSNNLLQLNANLLNLKLEGVSSSIMKDTTFDWDKLVTTLKLSVPKVKIAADYTATGNIYNLPLDSKGQVQMTIDNIDLFIAMRVKLRDEFGFTFTDVEKFRLEITNVGGFEIHLDNLFNGDKQLEASTNTLINENWRELYAIMQDPITDAMRTIMGNWVTKVFGYVPASLLAVNLPKAADRSG